MSKVEEKAITAATEYGMRVEGAPQAAIDESRDMKSVARWQHEIQENGEKVPFSVFKEALEIFSNDYGLVGHAGDPTVTPFEAPRENAYSLTQLNDLGEDEIKEQLQGKKWTVFIECMDKRGVRGAYDHLKETNPDLLVLSMGGGVVQTDSVRSGEKDYFSARGQALTHILNYLAQNAEIEKVIATGHDCNCGACKHYAGGVPVTDQLATNGESVVPGGEEEQREMARRINQASEKWIPEVLQEKTISMLSRGGNS